MPIITDAQLAALKQLLADITAANVPAPVPVPVPDPVQPAGKLTVTADPGDGRVAVTWGIPRVPTALIVARSGKDTSGAGPWSTPVPASSDGYVFDKLTPGTPYSFSVNATYADGTTETATATATPTGIIPVEPKPGTGRRVPLVAANLTAANGKPTGLGSGLTVNSLYFRSGVDDLAGLVAQGARRGRNLDGLMTFAYRGAGTRDKEGRPQDPWAVMAGDDAQLRAYKAIIDAGGIVVFSLPFAPEIEGAAMNSKAAKGQYKAQQQALAARHAQFGLNSDRFVYRLAWEWNGTWYAWSVNNGGPAVFKQAWTNTVDNYRAGGMTNARLDLCSNKGPQPNLQTDVTEVFVPGYVDVLGIDHYDMWPKQLNAAGFAQACAQKPGIDQLDALTAKYGIQWSLDEGANVNPAGANSGGDNPAWYTMMYARIQAAADRCAWFNTYDDAGAPSTFRHDFDSNPRSFAEYKRLLKAWPAR